MFVHKKRQIYPYCLSIGLCSLAEFLEGDAIISSPCCKGILFCLLLGFLDQSGESGEGNELARGEEVGIMIQSVDWSIEISWIYRERPVWCFFRSFAFTCLDMFLSGREVDSSVWSIRYDGHECGSEMVLFAFFSQIGKIDGFSTDGTDGSLSGYGSFLGAFNES